MKREDLRLVKYSLTGSEKIGLFHQFETIATSTHGVNYNAIVEDYSSGLVYVVQIKHMKFMSDSESEEFK
jgi:hypothetical protein